MKKMKKSLLLLISGLVITSGLSSQSINDEFFSKVSYVGAFDGEYDWTAGWTEWGPVNAEYPEPSVTKGNGQFTRAGGTHITANETWSGVIRLDGWVYVDGGATLTIEPGTIIRGTERSVLSVERGAKIMAAGTLEEPIVFTSAQGAGFRGPSDWAGLVINGYAPNNLPGGVGIAEGGIGSEYGGNNPQDNSGVLTYVRIEFPGYEVATGSEVNGLTLNSVGNTTRIEYIQISYSGDDGYEWFGGTVNSRYLISYKTEDDDFDTDNGFSGMVQFGLILRDPEIVDTDTANGFESDNDRDGSNTTPVTKAIFSNISGFGAAADQATYDALPQNHREGAALRIRRNSRISVYNSLFLGWGRGLRFESSGTHGAAQSGELAVKNTFIGGIFGAAFLTDNSVLTAAQLEQWFKETTHRNRVLQNMEEAMIADPFNFENPDFQPQAGSPVFNASYWITTSAPQVYVPQNHFALTNYPNPFNRTTSIKLTLTKNSPVKIMVHNLSGQLAGEIYQGELHEGTHQFSFNAGHLPKGIYYGKVIVDNQVQTIKMISQ
jgi:hypothetical protein